MRWLAFVAALCLCGPALAQQQPCFDDPALWATPYSQGTIQLATYYPQTQMLTILFFSGGMSTYVSVPLTIARGLVGPVSADAYYNSRINGRYQQGILTDPQGCPLLNETAGTFLISGG